MSKKITTTNVDRVAGSVRNITPLPAAFVRSLDAAPGLDDPKALCDALEGVSPVSIRVNPFKVTSRPDLAPVPWSRYGFVLESRPQFTLDPLMHAGHYYVQEAGSMFIEHIVRSASGDTSGLRILDLCAAPGGKTTLLSTLAGLDGLVVANEPVRQRAMTLADSVYRWGLGNTLVTNNDPSHFSAIENYFDIVLVDAPCSGEGMFRKNPEAREHWSEDNVALCAARQRRILGQVWNSLKPGGILIYSTCTFNRAENEDNVQWLVSELGAGGVEVEVDPSWGIVAGQIAGGVRTFRFYPHKTASEGFFAAVVRKEDTQGRRGRLPKARRAIFAQLHKNDSAALRQWVSQPEFMRFASVGNGIHGYYEAAYNDMRAISEALSAVASGVEMGELFHGSLRPEHSLALFHDVNRDQLNEAPLNLEEALNYLRRGEVDPALLEEGINLITFDGAALGWVKRIGRRTNNMYPKHLRITNL